MINIGYDLSVSASKSNQRRTEESITMSVDVPAMLRVLSDQRCYRTANGFAQVLLDCCDRHGGLMETMWKR
jgi:hypothetical protein